MQAEEGGTRTEEREDETVEVKLRALEKETLCPICLGVLRKTMMVKECMHRFCRDCIHTALRINNNECPACRTHLPSKRSLRVDERFDAIIAALYEDLDRYEEAERAHVLDTNRKHQEEMKKAMEQFKEKIRAQHNAVEWKDSTPRRKRGRPPSSGKAAASQQATGAVVVGTPHASAITLMEGDLMNEKSETAAVDHNGGYQGGRPRVKQSVQNRIPGSGNMLRPVVANTRGETSGSQPGKEEEINKKYLLPSLNDPPPHTLLEKVDMEAVLSHQDSLAHRDEECPIDCVLLPFGESDLPELKNKYLSCWPGMTISEFRKAVVELFGLQGVTVQEGDISILCKQPNHPMGATLLELDLSETIRHIYYRCTTNQCNLDLFYVKRSNGTDKGRILQ